MSGSFSPHKASASLKPFIIPSLPDFSFSILLPPSDITNSESLSTVFETPKKPPLPISYFASSGVKSAIGLPL
jgi:hypothetical protein